MTAPVNDAEILSVLLFGDSHVIGQAAREFDIGIDVPPRRLKAIIRAFFAGGGFFAFDSVVTFPDGRLGLNPMFEVAMRNWPGLDFKGRPMIAGTTVHKNLVLSLGTSASSYDPTLEHDDREQAGYMFRHDIDFVLPSHPDLPVDPACTLVPVALLRDMYLELLQPLRQALGFLAESQSARIWVLGCPPPAETNEVKRRTFDEIGAGLSRSIQLPGPLVALKLWNLVNQCVEALCVKADVRFIDCAPIACDERGFLRPEFVHDGIHGNSRYNEALARYLVTEIVKAGVNKPR